MFARILEHKEAAAFAAAASAYIGYQITSAKDQSRIIRAHSGAPVPNPPKGSDNHLKADAHTGQNLLGAPSLFDSPSDSSQRIKGTTYLGDAHSDQKATSMVRYGIRTNPSDELSGYPNLSHADDSAEALKLFDDAVREAGGDGSIINAESGLFLQL